MLTGWTPRATPLSRFLAEAGDGKFRYNPRPMRVNSRAVEDVTSAFRKSGRGMSSKRDDPSTWNEQAEAEKNGIILNAEEKLSLRKLHEGTQRVFKYHRPCSRCGHGPVNEKGVCFIHAYIMPLKPAEGI